MRPVVIVLTLFLLIANSFFVSQIQADANDDILKEKIIGSWSEGESPFTVATFKKGGVYEGKMYDTPKKQQLLVIGKGKWWIKDGKLYNTVHNVEPPIIPTKEEPYIDIIVDISNGIMTLIDDKGKEYTKKKVD